MTRDVPAQATVTSTLSGPVTGNRDSGSDRAAAAASAEGSGLGVRRGRRLTPPPLPGPKGSPLDSGDRIIESSRDSDGGAAFRLARPGSWARPAVGIDFGS